MLRLSLALCLALLTAGSASAMSGMLPVSQASNLLLVLTSAKPAARPALDQQFDRYMRQMVAVSGVARAQRLGFVPGGGGPNGVTFDAAALYEITTAAQPRFEDEVAARMKDGRLVTPDAVDAAKTRQLLYRPLGPATAAADVPGASSPTPGAGPLRDYYLVVMSDPATAAQEDAFNRWYNLQHVPDVLRVPGFQTGQRFIRIGGAGDAARYLVVFHFKSHDVDATSRDIGRRIREKITVMSSAFGQGSGFAAAPVGAVFQGLPPREGKTTHVK